MTKSAIMVLVVLVVLGSAGTAAASPPDPRSPSDTTDEVIVNAQREKLSVLRAQVVMLEDQIYSEYNKLNPDHQYDVTCITDVPTNSLLRNRQCLPEYARRALHDAAQSLLPFGYPARPASMVILEKHKDFQKNYRTVINTHAELLKLDREYGELVKHYEAVRKQKF